MGHLCSVTSTSPPLQFPGPRPKDSCQGGILATASPGLMWTEQQTARVSISICQLSSYSLCRTKAVIPKPGFKDNPLLNTTLMWLSYH